VHHTTVHVTITAELTCEHPIDTTGTFTSFVVDTYADLDGRRWLTRTTYPNGATYVQVFLGDPIYADAAYTNGTRLNATAGCIAGNGDRNVLSLDSSGGFSLTLATDLPVEDGPYVQGFSELGDLIGDATDDEGRRTQLWQQQITGTADPATAHRSSRWSRRKRGGWTPTIARPCSSTASSTRSKAWAAQRSTSWSWPTKPSMYPPSSSTPPASTHPKPSADRNCHPTRPDL